MLTTIAKKIDNEYLKVDDVSEINHITKVFRYNIGDMIRAIDFEKEYLCIINKISKNEIILKIENSNEDKYTLKRSIDIAIGIIKNDKMKFLIQKLTEIGINEIIPLKTERTVVKLDDKKEKWDLIVKESMKQCRAIKKTNISIVNEIKRLNYEKYDKIIYAYESSESSIKIQDSILENDKNILYLIGPEGGFSSAEIEFLKNKNAIEISLGKRILRAETAAIVVAGILANI